MAQTEAQARSLQGPESIRANTAFALAMRVGSAVFTAGLTLFLVRYLGPDDYGVYALALGVGGLLLLPADFGISRSAARFIAERRGREPEVAGVLRHALMLKAVGGGIVAGALMAAAGPIAAAYGEPTLAWPLRIMAVAVLGQSLLLLFTSAFEALGRNSVGFRLTVLESAVEVGSSLALVLAGAGVIGAVAGRAVGYGFGALLGLLFMLRLLGRRSLRGARPETLRVRRIAGYAGALFVIDSAFAAFAYIDTLLIGAFLGATSAGFFSAPAQILISAQYVGMAVAAGVAPRLARGGDPPNVRAFQQALRLLLTFQFLLVAPVVVWATPITELLLGADYGASADVFRGLGPYVVMMGPGPLLALGVNYLGEARRRIPLALGALAINALVDVLFIPRIGIVAGAIGTDIAYLFFLTGHVVICRSVIELDLWPLAQTALRSLAAAAAMAAVLLAFGTSTLSAVEAVAGAALGVLAYVAVLLATNEFSRSELRTAGRLVRSVAPR